MPLPRAPPLPHPSLRATSSERPSGHRPAGRPRPPRPRLLVCIYASTSGLLLRGWRTEMGPPHPVVPSRACGGTALSSTRWHGGLRGPEIPLTSLEKGVWVGIKTKPPVPTCDAGGHVPREPRGTCSSQGHRPAPRGSLSCLLGGATGWGCSAPESPMNQADHTPLHVTLCPSLLLGGQLTEGRDTGVPHGPPSRARSPAEQVREGQLLRQVKPPVPKREASGARRGRSHTVTPATRLPRGQRGRGGRCPQEAPTDGCSSGDVPSGH